MDHTLNKIGERQRSVLCPMSQVSHDHDFDSTIIKSASGILLKTSFGDDLIDGSAGLWCANIGYGHPRMAQTAKAAIKKLSYVTTFGGLSNEPVNRLAEKLLSLLHVEAGHNHLSQVFFGMSGSDANDSAVKISRYYQRLLGNPSKTKILALEGGYHGLTVNSTSLTGIEAYKINGQAADVIHLKCPHFLRNAHPGESEDEFTNRLLAEATEVVLSESNNIAAFIMEPVLGVAGVIIPPKGYLKKLSELLKAHNILFIVDEIITGLGRTGNWFGISSHTIRPDILTISKGLTGGYFPISACVISRSVIEVLSKAAQPFMHGFTFSGHPVGAALGLTNIDILEKEGLVAQAQATGAYLHQCLSQRLSNHRLIKDIRHIGQMHAIEYVQNIKSSKPFFRLVSSHALKQGLICRPLPYFGVNALSPAFTCTRSVAEEITEKFGGAVDIASLHLEL